ncbi:MAG: sugar ABC transporter ATP-binding protein, partial [Eubacteriales bacterium]|nr:sugar ABC transporter ATP-binding protein [Eubacteriales bacterium]
GVRALNEVSIEVKQGEVHAIVGENGAGKSTLIKMISGADTPDSGKIIYNGKTYEKMMPHLVRALGIATIYQEFNLVPTLSVAENVFLGDYPIYKAVNYKEIERKAKALFDMVGINIDPRTLVSELTVAYQQMVEIVKAISKDVKLLILDEPTAPLSKQEVDTLFNIIGNLKKRGVTFIYISHRLAELYRICDRVSVMRDGHMITTLDIKDAERDVLIRHMVGRQFVECFPSCKEAMGDVVLEAKNVTGKGVEDISLKVRKGEILGLAGLIGAGRTEFARIVFGLEKLEKGQIFLNGKEVTIKKPGDAVALGIGLIPEDRKQEGLVLCLTVKSNIGFVVLKRLSKILWIQRQKEKEYAQGMKESLDIRTPSLDQIVQNLSGGNQQKVVLAKWLAADAKILILDEPTRGIDVGAKQEFYNLIKGLADSGVAVIMISSELEELLGMAHRIMVFCEGRVTGELCRDEFDQERVLDLAATGM